MLSSKELVVFAIEHLVRRRVRTRTLRPSWLSARVRIRTRRPKKFSLFGPEGTCGRLTNRALLLRPPSSIQFERTLDQLQIAIKLLLR